MELSIFGDIVENTADQRRTFFKLVFGENASGWICIAYLHPHTKQMTKHFYEWPKDLEAMLEDINERTKQLVHAYFCPSLYDSPGKKNKEYIKTCTNVWADLDTCDPRHLLVKPSITVQTSPGRFQALWLLDDPTDPQVAENISCKIAYYHAPQGADKSGWDLSQLLRIPYTPNYKYGDLHSAPVVTIVEAKRLLYRPSDFNKYPVIEPIKQYVETEMPKLPNVSVQELLSDQNRKVTSDIINLFNEVPTDDWSGRLWNLLRMCAEAGFKQEETFIIANASACNKYRRDKRPETELWRDVNKAYLQRVEFMKLLPTPTSTIPKLLTQEEEAIVTKRRTFIENYMDWACTVTDAAPQFHQAGAFIILSALLAGAVRLETSFGKIIPNLWFMILGNTTITRKTTSMNLAMRLLYEVDESLLLATDGSLEGILVGMQGRPKLPSIFLRDEFTGLLEAIAHRDYMAGFSEQLTKLYDGEPLKRLLRKETIDIKDPVFIMYVGGIKNKTQMMLTDELVMGGFIPRFVIISAEPDLSRVRPIGPPVETNDEGRDLIKNELVDICNHYLKESRITHNGENLGRVAPEYRVRLTSEAWRRYNEFETLMIKTALDTGLDYLTPVYDRLAKSTLKAAMLIAASSQRTNEIVVGINEILHAIYYARSWREFSSEIVNGIGKTYDERLMDRMLATIASSPVGASRADLMNMYHLDAKRADLLLKTMDQRGLILLTKGAYRVRY